MRVGGWGRGLESESGWVGERVREWAWVCGGEGVRVGGWSSMYSEWSVDEWI